MDTQPVCMSMSSGAGWCLKGGVRNSTKREDFSKKGFFWKGRVFRGIPYYDNAKNQAPCSSLTGSSTNVCAITLTLLLMVVFKF